MRRKVTAMYFSPTGTTEKVTREISRVLAGSDAYDNRSFTKPGERKTPAVFGKDDLAVVGVPVYSGRIPALLPPYLETLEGNGALAVAVVVYGNRAYEDALLELADILEARGFRVVAAGAFIGEHTFTSLVAAGRPDEKDLEEASRFARLVKEKLDGGDLKAPQIPGSRPYKPIKPMKTPQGELIDTLTLAPKLKDTCIKCMLCFKVCPTGCIDDKDPAALSGKCILCSACVKVCPVGAKYYDSPMIFAIAESLEKHCSARREPEWFI
ncbi:EFR1 family ferrodoxin [Papillibacter cinnamivorans]|uniref:4Fe-4S dicluster domain-containing protein n=1 Tax=Papillibacter cinnamivorans DSM 12816 TaxID=1122930 RepID=A0A1W2CUJ7_9FIRM|nr:EFR1 family ferrodoxin [Papillibacter cinnamivorans]SMC88909.1 4Fe-4S dicluster domain-containing protein [Papillibacter cinnamivorans DSM 12816]